MWRIHGADKWFLLLSSGEVEQRVRARLLAGEGLRRAAVRWRHLCEAQRADGARRRLDRLQGDIFCLTVAYIYIVM